WAVPPLTTPESLARWLGLDPRARDWFADYQGREKRSPSGSNRRYTYRWVAKRDGSARLVEVPCGRLKAIQRRLLDHLLAGVPSHEAAHGFRTGRSVRTYAEPHVGRRVVLKLDLRDFFPSVSAGRVVSLFLTIGYPEPV